MSRHLIPAVGAMVALLLTACTSGPGNHERWLRSHDGVTAVTSTQLPTRKFGDRPAWHVIATLSPEATVADMAQLSAEWPARAKESRLTLRRPASGDRPELSFTAWPDAGWTETRWEVFALLQSTWPTAGVSMGEDQTGTVHLEHCDPWNELDRIDVVEVLAHEYGVPLTMECRTGTVELSRRSVPTTDHLTRLRARTRAVLSHLPAVTSWKAEADRPESPVRIEVRTPTIANQPTSAVLAQEDAVLTIRTTESVVPVTVTVTGEVDLRDVARATTQLTWLDSIEVDSQGGSIELHGDLGRIGEIVPLADRHPKLSWWLAESGQGKGNWVRSPGSEFGERARQYQALVESGIDWTSIVLHNNQGRRTMSLEVAEHGDWRPVVEAIRGVGWTGDMRVDLGSSYPGVEFTSTTSGPARDAEVASSQGAPDPQRHPELIEILRAWDATAS